MESYGIIIDTNVLLTALCSSAGASYRLLSLIDAKKYEVSVSVPLLIEYEDVLKRNKKKLNLSTGEINDILDYICLIANKHKIFYLWRPFLRDPKDDLVLELAVEASSSFIVTYNKKDFKDVDQFGIRLVTPKEFLQIIGEIP